MSYTSYARVWTSHYIVVYILWAIALMRLSAFSLSCSSPLYSIMVSGQDPRVWARWSCPPSIALMKYTSSLSFGFEPQSTSAIVSAAMSSRFELTCDAILIWPSDLSLDWPHREDRNYDQCPTRWARSCACCSPLVEFVEIDLELAILLRLPKNVIVCATNLRRRRAWCNQSSTPQPPRSPELCSCLHRTALLVGFVSSSALPAYKGSKVTLVQP